MEDRVIHTLLTVSLIIAVIIAFFIISIIRYHRRYIALQKERINAEIIMQESERKRIANDLHDSLGPLLSAVKLNIQSLEVQAGEDQFIVEKAGQHIDEIIESLREISYNLLPNTLNRKGLSDAVEEYLYRISSSQNIKIKFDLKGINLIDKKKEIHLFRIIQEIVHNVIKHSGATEMQIYSQQKTSELNLYLKDNGLGFEPEQVSKVSSGLGLKSIESRCELIGALCELNTSIGKGCSFTIKIPFA
jgi:signal transduction histidine kinase